MGTLTYYKPNGEWGVEGIDLAALPPKVYGALCKLHDLEHHEDIAMEYLAKLCGVDLSRLIDFIQSEKLGGGAP